MKNTQKGTITSEQDIEDVKLREFQETELKEIQLRREQRDLKVNLEELLEEKLPVKGLQEFIYYLKKILVLIIAELRLAHQKSIEEKDMEESPHKPLKIEDMIFKVLDQLPIYPENSSQESWTEAEEKQSRMEKFLREMFDIFRSKCNGRGLTFPYLGEVYVSETDVEILRINEEAYALIGQRN